MTGILIVNENFGGVGLATPQDGGVVMDHGTLYDIYRQARDSGNLDELRAFVPRIDDAHPLAAEMLNCCGHEIGQHAQDLQELWKAVRLIERAEPLAADPLILAKIRTNLAYFYVVGNRPDDALVAVKRALAVPLEWTDSWIHGHACYQAGQAHRLLEDDAQAQAEFETALTYPVSAARAEVIHICLAIVAARLDQPDRAQAHLQQASDVIWLPYVTGVRARLALTGGRHEEAVLLSRAAVAAFAARRPQPYLWFPAVESWWLYRECLLAAGYQEEAAVAEQRWLERAENWAYQDVRGGFF